MRILVAYLVVMVPLLGLAAAALWPPRRWQAALLVAGPALAALAAAGFPGVERLGWLLVLGVPWALALVLPLVPWRREWARLAIPLVVLALVVTGIALARGAVAAVVYLGLPGAAAVLGLGLLALARHDRRVDAAAAAAAAAAATVGR
ncbi:hypothetical protein [Arthrobacter sp. NEB 688]|uniref:hypothetical protein n=1 Tax=Arthrobacter sp. NEB 688 TaxID=904039 RepID=UPI0015651479|nr:hypothetical protein [Arthrobacter sp. NEB 688]QKE82837.1 hypothetical protein HL663_01970 [Arthrobacter sp. NEB 688]